MARIPPRFGATTLTLALLLAAALPAAPAIAKMEDGEKEECENIVELEPEDSEWSHVPASIFPADGNADSILRINPNDSADGSLDSPGNTYPRPGDYGEIVVVEDSEISDKSIPAITRFTKQNYGGLGGEALTKTYRVTNVSAAPYGQSVGSTYYPAGSYPGSGYLFTRASSPNPSGNISFSFEGVKVTPDDTPVYAYFKITLTGRADDGDTATTVMNVGYKVTVIPEPPYRYLATMCYDATGGTIDGQPNTKVSKVIGPAHVWATGTVDPPSSATFDVTDTIPVREGYVFLFWRDAEFLNGYPPRRMYRGAASTPSADESPLGMFGYYEDTFEVSQADTATGICPDNTLYAVWDKTCSLAYDAAGGDVTPETERSTFGISWRTGASNPEKSFVAAAAPAREGYAFKGWKASDGTVYQPGDTVTLTPAAPDETLVALWEAESSTHKPGDGGTGEPTDPTDPSEPGDPDDHGGSDNPGAPDDHGGPGSPDDPGAHPGTPGTNPGTSDGSGDSGNQGSGRDSGSGASPTSGSTTKKGSQASGRRTKKAALPATGDASLLAPAVLGGSGIVAAAAAAVMRRRH